MPLRRKLTGNTWRARFGRGEFQKVAVCFHCLPSGNTKKMTLAALLAVRDHSNSTIPAWGGLYGGNDA
jgi:hypothetical protein